MKVSKHDANEEKRIVTGMVVNDVVLGRVAERWKDGGRNIEGRYIGEVAERLALAESIQHAHAPATSEEQAAMEVVKPAEGCQEAKGEE